MFDKKKIYKNYTRALNKPTSSSKLFFSEVSKDLISRGGFEKNSKNYKILEYNAINNSLFNEIKKKKIDKYFFQSVFSEKFSFKNKNTVISDLEKKVFSDNFFDCCFNILSLNYSSDILNTFLNIYSILKPNGKFICVLPGEDNFLFFRNIFLKYCSSNHNKTFHPVIDIMSLGSLGQKAGFKNIVVDKTKLRLRLKCPKSVWSFMRAIGESNALSERNKLYFGKQNYAYLIREINNKGIDSCSININYFIGYKG